MKLICIECKNDVDLSTYSNLVAGYIVECQMCGITLEVISIDNGCVQVEIVEEGK